MDEENKQTTGNSGDGNKPEEIGLIDKANAAAERLEAANQKQEELISRQEELTAKAMLAGRSEAGQPSTNLSEEEKKKIGAKEFFKGSIIENAIEKHG